jgi:hypothetical protein
LRYDQRFVLEMASGTDVAQTEADEQATRNAADGKQPALRAVEDGQTAGSPNDKQAPVAKAKIKQTPPRPSAKIKTAKTNGKTVVKSSGSKNSVAVKSKATKARTVKAKAIEKKRAEAKRAALNVTSRKTALTNRPAVSAGQGQ